MSEYIINGDFVCKTVKAFVSYLGVSRAELTRLKKIPDGITVNGNHVTVRYILCDGDVLRLQRDDNEDDVNPMIVPTDVKIDIIYEDDEIIAVNKPPHMPTHPSLGHENDSLANAVAFEFEKRGVPFVFRGVNRLDRDTSGVVIIAKNKSAAFRYSEYFQSGNVIKKYVCIVDGEITDRVTVNRNIKRKNESIIERVTCESGEGQSAETEIEPLAYSNGMTFCEVHPKTGRTHQIRVHTAYIGHPIIGDTLYGNESEYISRQALHCSYVEISTEKGTVKISAPIPDDMSDVISEFYGK